MEEFFNKYKGLIIGLLILALFVLMVYLFNSNGKTSTNNRPDYNILKDYEINEVIPIYITDEELAKKYLSEYVNLLIYHREEAFKLVDTDTLVNKFENYDAFNKYVNNMMTSSFLKATVKKYDYGVFNGSKEMRVIDADNNKFIFKEKSLMNYTVEF